MSAIPTHAQVLEITNKATKPFGITYEAPTNIQTGQNLPLNLSAESLKATQTSKVLACAAAINALVAAFPLKGANPADQMYTIQLVGSETFERPRPNGGAPIQFREAKPPTIWVNYSILSKTATGPSGPVIVEIDESIPEKEYCEILLGEISDHPEIDALLSALEEGKFSRVIIKGSGFLKAAGKAVPARTRLVKKVVQGSTAQAAPAQATPAQGATARNAPNPTVAQTAPAEENDDL